jgi:alpha-ketoglutarate-dependent taurine dioxygenase
MDVRVLFLLDSEFLKRKSRRLGHTDLVHLAFPPGYTHLHQDTVPEVGGDTLWVRFPGF